MYFGGIPQGAQGWHWGNHAPNTGGACQYGVPALNPEASYTVTEQTELYLVARDVLKEHGITNYHLAVKLVDKLASTRDRQRARVSE